MGAERWRQQWALHTPQSLRSRVQELGASKYAIDGVLPVRSVAILLGDSGLGKSALMYQAAICVAAGVPFLGCETAKGSTLIADFENGLGDVSDMVDRIRTYLQLPEDLVDLHLWSLSDCAERFGQVNHSLLDILLDVKPSLAIIDTLGSYEPDAESKNSLAAKMLKNLRIVAKKCGTSTIFVHHRRKQPRNAEESAGPLETANVRQWFQDARGASSLVNGCDVRLGVDAPDLSSVNKEEVSLVLRGFGRVRGEIDPIYIARDSDENGDPVGYRQLTGPELLFDKHRQDALAKLPQSFGFKEAKIAYGRADQATSNFLSRCGGLKLVRRVGRGRFEKVGLEGAQGDGAGGERT